MKTHITLVTAERHKNTHVRQDLGYPHASTMTHSIIVESELEALIADYVLAFMKHSETGAFQMVALLGLEPECNAYKNDRGWNATYVPLNIKRYPFSLGAVDDEAVALCIDEAASVLTTDTSTPALFDEMGNETEYLISQRKALETLRNEQEKTQNLIQALIAENLITPFHYTLTYQDGREQRVEGLYNIDLQSLNLMEAKALQNLHAAGYLSNAFMIALSQTHFSRLAQLHNAQRSSVIAKVQIERG